MVQGEEIDISHSNEIIDDNWILTLNYNLIDIKTKEDVYLLLNYTVGK